MHKGTIIAVICVGTVVCGGVVQGDSGSGSHVRVSVTPRRAILADGIPARYQGSTLRIHNVRLEAPPLDGPKPSVILKFDLLNDSDVRITDVMIEIAIVAKPQTVSEPAPRVIVRPFIIRGHVTIEAGYTVAYQMLLRNLAPDCECQADVNVVSARPLG